MNERQIAEVFGQALVGDTYTMEDVEDVMAVLFLKSFQAVPMMSADSETLLSKFFLRAGIATEQDIEQLDEKLAEYFEKKPLRQDLLRSVVEGLGSGGQPKALRAGYAISSAF